MLPSELTVVLGDGQVVLDGDTRLRVIIYAVKAGLSGFDIVLTIEDPSVAEIIAAEFPDYGLNEATNVPTNRIRLRAVDLKDIVPLSASAWVLCTVTIRGKSKGSSAIVMEVLAMDDDLGRTMSPLVESDVLTVK
jgi:hypothetical protein